MKNNFLEVTLPTQDHTTIVEGRDLSNIGALLSEDHRTTA